MNAENYFDLFFCCKVGQIEMKLELDMCLCLLDVYTKFEIDISKHVEKKPRKLRKIQNAQK